MQKTKILLISEENFLRASFKKLLKKKGYRAKSAEDYVSGIEKLKKEDYQIVIVAGELSKALGLRLLESAKSTNLFIEVIFIGDNFTLDFLFQSIKHGAFHLFQGMLIETEELLDVIEKAKIIFTLKKEMILQTIKNKR